MSRNNGNFKGRIILVQRYTSKVDFPESCIRMDPDLGEAIHFENEEEYAKWLANDNAEPKRTKKEKENLIPFKGL